jgi:hypothetical protein
MEEAVFWLFVSVLAAIATGVVAYRRGLGVWWTVFLCMFCWPAGLVLVLVLPANKKKLEQRALKSGASKQCPYCAEIIRSEARICPHCRQSCGTTISQIPAPTPQRVPTATSGLEIFHCPHCLNKCLVPKDLAGEMSCPHCSQVFYVEAA